jgi:hypothetical protein
MIYFLTTSILDNYKNTPNLYNDMTKFKGKDVHSSYLFWILKNNGIKNISLVSELPSNINDDDTVIFHFDNRTKINFLANYKKVQILSDKPPVFHCDMYLSADKSVCVDVAKKLVPGEVMESTPWLGGFYTYNLRINYFPEPLPLNLKKCTPVFPPRKFFCNALELNIAPWLLQFCNAATNDKFNIVKKIINKKMFFKHIDESQFIIESKYNHNHGNEDVFFFSRNYDQPQSGFKHCNRLFSSFKAGVPILINEDKNLLLNKKSDYDYLPANNLEQFVNSLYKIYTDKEYFINSIRNCDKRKDENNYSDIVNRFNQLFL